MIRLLPNFVALAVFVAATLPATAVLKVGDPAPRLQVGEWAQGEEVGEFEGDKVYLVEFWASWCGPCISAIPHINQLHKRHRESGLVVIGQNLGEDRATVSKFVKQMGAKMTYRVAVDQANGAMGRKWLTAAGQKGIPCAFVVNKSGRIAYIGHPMSLDESLLRGLLAEPSTKAADTAAPAPADTPGEKATALAARASDQLRRGDLDEAEASIAALHDELPDNFLHLGGLFELELLVARGQNADAVALATALDEDFTEKPEVRCGIARRLVAPATPGADMLALAESIAKPLATEESAVRSSALSVLARIAFQRGDRDEAVDFQTKAAAAAPDDAAAKTDLEAYQNGRLP